MSKESSKAKVEKQKKQTRNTLTAKGIYDKQRSKFLKDPKTGYGRVISVAREKLLEKNGGEDPGPDVVAFHIEGGSHKNGKTEDEKAIWATKGQNTSESNMRRAGRVKEYIKKKLKLKY